MEKANAKQRIDPIPNNNDSRRERNVLLGNKQPQHKRMRAAIQFHLLQSRDRDLPIKIHRLPASTVHQKALISEMPSSIRVHIQDMGRGVRNIDASTRRKRENERIRGSIGAIQGLGGYNHPKRDQ